MPLLGTAAMLLSFDIVPEAVAEHDEWHTHEHLPERLSIPGFLRGTRWVAVNGQPRYFVLYEVERLETLSSDAYLQRLNNPTPWTSRMMPHYRGMSRGLCSVVASHGLGMGHFGLLARLTGTPAADKIDPRLSQRRGLGSVHLFAGAASAQMTNEQRIRGPDAGVEGALLVTGYDQHALEDLARGELSDVASALYRTDYTLTAQEVSGRR